MWLTHPEKSCRSQSTNQSGEWNKRLTDLQLCFSICRFSQVVRFPRAQPHAQSLFSISNSFWCYFCYGCASPPPPPRPPVAHPTSMRNVRIVAHTLGITLGASTSDKSLSLEVTIVANDKIMWKSFSKSIEDITAASKLCDAVRSTIAVNFCTSYWNQLSEVSSSLSDSKANMNAEDSLCKPCAAGGDYS